MKSFLIGVFVTALLAIGAYQIASVVNDSKNTKATAAYVPCAKTDRNTGFFTGQGIMRFDAEKDVVCILVEDEKWETLKSVAEKYTKAQQEAQPKQPQQPATSTQPNK